MEDKKETKKIKEKKLKKEIQDLVNEIYRLEEEDEDIRYAFLREYRDEIIRACIISLHVSIEEMLQDLIVNYLTKENKKLQRKKSFNEFIGKELRFLKKLDLAKIVGVINKKVYGELQVLNTIRNKCAHNWFLNIKIWKKEGKKKREKPFIEYNNKNLFDKEVFLEEFLPKYNGIFIKLVKKSL